MATVERKTTETDEKHSLSSFDKRRAQCIAFGARQHNKKYRIADKKSYSGNAPTASKNISDDVQENNSAEKVSAKSNVAYASSQRTNIASQRINFETQNEQKSAIEDRPTISPEMAERMKRAAFIQQMNKESIAYNVASAKSVESANVSTVSEEKVDSFENSATTQKGTSDVNSNAEKSVKSAIDDYKSGITPEIANRMKRAAFLAHQNKEAIAVNTASIISCDELSEEKTSSISDEKCDSIPENAEKLEENFFESKFTGNSESADFNRHDAVRHDYAVNQAYGRYTENNRRKQQERENARHRNVLDEISSAASITGHLSRGEVGKVVADTVIKSALSDNGVLDSVQTMVNSVSSSSSVSSAVPDVAATLAAVEAKKMVAKILKGESSEKDRAFIEEHIAKGRTKYVDPGTERHMVDWQLSEDKAISEEMSREERRNYLHNKRVAEKQKSFYADRKAIERKNKQKEMFLDFNKDNPDLASNTAKSAGKKYVAKKASKALIGGGAAAAVVPIIIIIIVFAIVVAFFGWLTPMSYTLAGDEGEEADRTYEAESNAEVIDGYAKLIKNYMDVTQAYYYLNYGDWYGGTYDYPAPDLDFGTFYQQYCQEIILQIQSQYMALIQNSTNIAEINALSQAMNNAISAALSQAMSQALAEYDALMVRLDDSLTPESHRQHYEVEQRNGSNNHADSVEFTGKPVVGTNNFGNTEINSDLSAEELLAYIALYKSMAIINPDDSDLDADQILNITPQDIMDFFEETEYVTITTEVTHNNFCAGMNCKRRLSSSEGGVYSWEYFCDGDHDNLSGEIGTCLTEDELRTKVMEITDSENNGVDEDSFNELIEEYLDLIKEELDIDEADFRQFGAADNFKAQEFYEKLVAEGAIPNNFWEVNTPIGEEDSDE